MSIGQQKHVEQRYELAMDNINKYAADRCGVYDPEMGSLALYVEGTITRCCNSAYPRTRLCINALYDNEEIFKHIQRHGLFISELTDTSITISVKVDDDTEIHITSPSKSHTFSYTSKHLSNNIRIKRYPISQYVSVGSSSEYIPGLKYTMPDGSGRYMLSLNKLVNIPERVDLYIDSSIDNLYYETEGMTYVSH